MPLITKSFSTPVLFAQNTASSHTGDTNQTTLATYTLRASTMKTVAALTLVSLWSFTNDASNKRLRTDIDAVAVFNNNGNTSLASATKHSTFFNLGSASSQNFIFSGAAASFGQTNSVGTSSLDTSADQTVNFATTLADAADTVTLEAGIIFLFN